MAVSKRTYQWPELCESGSGTRRLGYHVWMVASVYFLIPFGVTLFCVSLASSCHSNTSHVIILPCAKLSEFIKTEMSTIAKYYLSPLTSIHFLSLPAGFCHLFILLIPSAESTDCNMRARHSRMWHQCCQQLARRCSGWHRCQLLTGWENKASAH